MTLGTLRLEADVTLAINRLAATGHEFAIHRQLNDAVAARHAVMIPLAGRFRAALAGEAAHPATGMRPIRLERGAVDRKDVTVTRVVVTVAPIQNLNFN